MATAIDERLGAMQHRIDRIEEKAKSTATAAKTRLEQYVATVKEDEASARAEAHRQAGAVDEKLEQLGNDLDIAEHRLAAELADDRKSFADAVQAELHDWDVFLERMQAKAAEKSAPARTEVEKAIADLRRRRTEITESLAGVREVTGEKWSDAKVRVLAALDELKSKADSVTKE